MPATTALSPIAKRRKSTRAGVLTAWWGGRDGVECAGELVYSSRIAWRENREKPEGKKARQVSWAGAGRTDGQSFPDWTNAPEGVSGVT